jgi:hypothetical protein
VTVVLSVFAVCSATASKVHAMAPPMEEEPEGQARQDAAPRMGE